MENLFFLILKKNCNFFSFMLGKQEVVGWAFPRKPEKGFLLLSLL
jgi:hypothetical protein